MRFRLLQLRALAKMKHFQLGKQCLTSVVGCGNPHREKYGTYSVFITHAKTDTLKQFPTLAIIE
jgi:hypothetical protein